MGLTELPFSTFIKLYFKTSFHSALIDFIIKIKIRIWSNCSPGIREVYLEFLSKPFLNWKIYIILVIGTLLLGQNFSKLVFIIKNDLWYVLSSNECREHYRRYCIVKLYKEPSFFHWLPLLVAMASGDDHKFWKLSPSAHTPF